MCKWFTSTHLGLAIEFSNSGCGIGGLTLAATISKFTSEQDGIIKVDMYESKSEVSVIGAGVGIWKRSWQVLQDLGFEEELVKRGVKVPVDGECKSLGMAFLSVKG